MNFNNEATQVTESNRVLYATAVWRHKKARRIDAMVGVGAVMGIAVMAALFLAGVWK